MNLVDGKKLAEKISEEVKERARGKNLSLGIIWVGDDAPSRQFIERKKKVGEDIGIKVKIYSFPSAETTRSLRKKIADLIKKTNHNGFVVQLPLPSHINTQYILNAVPEAKDVDLLNQKSIGAFAVGRSRVAPPVVGAVEALLKAAGADLKSKKIVILGAGRLVGKPIALWLTEKNLPFSLLTEDSKSIEEDMRTADIIISGVGKPNLIRGDMIKNGALIIDAGTSVAEGKTMGDVDAKSLGKNDGWLSPVPGGVGPLTVAYIFKNLTILNHD